MTKPLLTVYIPTYNRAELLRSIVHTLALQAAELGDKVEILVSDNASPDHTGEVVKWAQQFGPIRYHRNDTNIGGGNNILQGPQKLASGEFCWVLGDDDLVREYALKTIVDLLEANPDIDYAFVNNCGEIGRPQGLVNPQDCRGRDGLRCDNLETLRVEKWERIIAFTSHPELFTFMGNHILRVAAWREHAAHAIPQHEFDSLASTYPHVLAVAKRMMGKPALYIGDPLIIVFNDDFRNNEWSPYLPLLKVVRQTQLTDFFAAQGMEGEMLCRYRNLHFSGISWEFWRMLTDKTIPGRENLRPLSMMARYGKYRGFWQMVQMYPIHTYVKPPLKPLTRAVRRLRAAKTEA